MPVLSRCVQVKCDICFVVEICIVSDGLRSVQEVNEEYDEEYGDWGWGEQYHEGEGEEEFHDEAVDEDLHV